MLVEIAETLEGANWAKSVDAKREERGPRGSDKINAAERDLLSRLPTRIRDAGLLFKLGNQTLQWFREGGPVCFEISSIALAHLSSI